MSVPESRIPVIVGVGQINDRPDVPHEGMDSLGLMVEALQRTQMPARAGWKVCLPFLRLTRFLSRSSVIVRRK